MSKVCTKCNIEKPFSMFYKHKMGKNGLSAQCKSCNKQYLESNKEKIAEYKKQYQKDNKEKLKEIRKKYYEANKEKSLEKSKQYNKDNKEKLKEHQIRWYQKNKEKIKEKRKEYNKKYREENKEIITKKTVQYHKQRKQKDPIFKFKGIVRGNIQKAFKRGKNHYRKTSKTETILGCTIEEFRTYIESKFKIGMSFYNHGEWHLDHIIPLSIAETEDDIVRLCHYTNYQPLWAKDNLIKGNKISNVQLKLI